jgi:hypothetical protein
VGNVPRQDIGTKIKITPHINDANQIRLEIEEEISEKGATEGTLQVVSIDRRTAKTEVMADDQQTIVIGGLMRDKIFNTETKIPILGDIPIIGTLFRKSERQKEKTNLLLFLTPYVIRDAKDLRSVYERKMRERQEFIDRNFVFNNEDYTPPIDYSRTRGLVAEIINEMQTINDALRLLEEDRNKKPLLHLPQEPVGFAPKPVAVQTTEVPMPDAEALDYANTATAGDSLRMSESHSEPAITVPEPIITPPATVAPVAPSPPVIVEPNITPPASNTATPAPTTSGVP